MAAQQATPNGVKGRGDARTLSPRDRAICDQLSLGRTEESVGLEFKITRARVSQILHTPAAVEYMTGSYATPRRILVHNMALTVLELRLRDCIKSGFPVPFRDLIKIIQVLQPPDQANQATEDRLHSEAMRMVDEMELPDDDKGRILQFIRGEAA